MTDKIYRVFPIFRDFSIQFLFITQSIQIFVRFPYISEMHPETFQITGKFTQFFPGYYIEKNQLNSHATTFMFQTPLTP